MVQFPTYLAMDMVIFATNAMQNRVNLLNQFTQKNISIAYIDKQNQNNQSLGTTVVFVIPIIY